MNVNDGKIHDLTNENLLKALGADMVRVKEDDMTQKQKKNKRVSLKDHRSKLGKQLTSERKLRGKGGVRSQQRNTNSKNR